ncbi:intraflagellar transport 20 -like protein, partial [Brachionus plicatilis]
MAEEALSNAGLYLDDLNKIRLLDPESAQQTTELKDECKDFVDRILEFQKIVQYFSEKFDEISKLVEKEKMKAIGSRNATKSMQKQAEGQVMQLKALYVERKMELERL